MSLHDDLSRLLAGELSPEEESRLLERIADDPETQEAWAAMQLVPQDLAGLPTFQPPPDLDAKVIEKVIRMQRASFSLWPLLIAAGLLVGILVPRPRPDVEILEGSQLVDGRVDALAAGVEVGVNGRARISVEPDAGAARGTGAEETDMKPLAAALVGSLVTVTVLEGTAFMKTPEGKKITVHEGETQSVPGRQEAAGAAPPKGGSVAAATEAELRARVDELESELHELKFEHAVTKGQLAQHEGTQQEFPSDLPDAFRPDAFKASLEHIAQGIEGTELVNVDCTEYPCIAIIGKNGPAESWGQDLKANLEAQFPGTDDNDPSLSIWMSNMSDGKDALSVAAVAVYPPKGQPGAEVTDGTGPEQRADYRAEGLMRDAAAEQRDDVR